MEQNFQARSISPRSGDLEQFHDEIIKWHKQIFIKCIFHRFITKSFFNNYIITFGISCSELYDRRSVKGKSLDNDHLLHSTTCPFLRCDCYNSVVWRSAKKACTRRCVGTSYWRDWSILYPVRYRKGYIGIKKPVERSCCMNIHSWNNPFLACSWVQKLETYKFPDFDKILDTVCSLWNLLLCWCEHMFNRPQSFKFNDP